MYSYLGYIRWWKQPKLQQVCQALSLEAIPYRASITLHICQALLSVFFLFGFLVEFLLNLLIMKYRPYIQKPTRSSNQVLLSLMKRRISWGLSCVLVFLLFHFWNGFLIAPVRTLKLERSWEKCKTGVAENPFPWAVRWRKARRRKLLRGM